MRIVLKRSHVHSSCAVHTHTHSLDFDSALQNTWKHHDNLISQNWSIVHFVICNFDQFKWSVDVGLHRRNDVQLIKCQRRGREKGWTIQSFIISIGNSLFLAVGCHWKIYFCNGSMVCCIDGKFLTAKMKNLFQALFSHHRKWLALLVSMKRNYSMLCARVCLGLLISYLLLFWHAMKLCDRKNDAKPISH